MNDFKDCYQSAVKDLGILGMKEFHMDASQCMDEGRHNRRVVRRMSRSAATAFSAACVIFLCGFGTVKAAEYLENVIKVQEWGFESADAATMARNETEYPRTYIVSEEVGLSMEDNDVKEVVGGEEGPVLFEAGEEDMTEEVEVEEMPVKIILLWKNFAEMKILSFPSRL